MYKFIWLNVFIYRCAFYVVRNVFVLPKYYFIFLFDVSLAADGCLQYWTGVSGQLSSFNYNNAAGLMLSNTDYTMCVRTERNFCGIQYTACPDTGYFIIFQAIFQCIIEITYFSSNVLYRGHTNNLLYATPFLQVVIKD